MKNKILPLAVIWALPGGAVAETAPPIVVTASRTAETADEALAPVTVITREDIEQRQPQTVLELLRTEPGISMARSGGPGTATSVYLRGTNADHVLVLIDGVRANSAGDGSFDWQYLDPAQIERIEIVRGPRSTLYGSNAIGGVIQIFTRDPEGFTGRIAGGSHATRSAQVGFGGGERTTYRANASHYESDGISAKADPDAFGFDPDRDGYENQSISGGISTPLGDTGELGVDGWVSRSESEFDEGTHDATNAAANIRTGFAVSENWYQSFQAGYVLDELETESGSVSTLEGRTTTVDWKNEFGMGAEGLLIVGADYLSGAAKKVDEDTGTIGLDKTFYNRAAYFSFRSGLPIGDVQFGARYDDHSEFGNKTTGQIAWGADLAENTRLIASYGTAFKAPTLQDLYWPADPYTAGNPDLEPEESANAEIELRQSFRNGEFTLGLFRNRIEHLIDWAETSPFFWQPSNIDDVVIRGVETGIRWSNSTWSTAANATYLDTENVETGEPLDRRPERKLTVVATRHFDNGSSVTLDALGVDERPDGGNTLPGYGLVNLAAQVPLMKGLQLEGRIENVGDKEYELASGFNALGRVYYVGLHTTLNR